MEGQLDLITETKTATKTAHATKTGQQTSPKKAIAPERDRLQSRWLVWIAGSLLALLALDTLNRGIDGPSAEILWLALGISFVFALVVWGMKAGTAAAAAFGAIVCMLVTYWTFSWVDHPLYSGLTPLMLLFILTLIATRAGKRRKVAAGLAEPSHGREASQVIANLGVAGLLASMGGITLLQSLSSSGSINLAEDRVQVMVLAALAEATADTVSAEIGQAFGGTPFLLTNLRKVAPGTDGAITPLGTLVGVAAAVLVVAGGVWAMALGIGSAAIALVAAILGLLFDSLLGATWERKGWIGNDLVNFTSTLFAAVLALLLMAVA